MSAQQPGNRTPRKKQSLADSRQSDDDTPRTIPGAEEDGGESILSGRSREHHPEVPEDVESPRPDAPHPR